MTEEQYEGLNNFGWNERDIKGRLLRDQIEHINYNFIKRLDMAITDAKDYHGRKAGQFIVYDFNTGQHNPDGYHPKGRAVDGSFWGLDLFQSYLIFERWRFGGIGIYPYTLPDKIVHTDNRGSFRNARWVRTKTEYIYSPISFEEQLMIESVE